MRPPILAAVLLTCACASSSPEPAAAPTPALDSAALARSAPRALVNAREQYYDIDGSSAGALRNQINRLGPKDESGKSQDALTVWSIEWAFGTAQQGDSCVLRDVKVTLRPLRGTSCDKLADEATRTAERIVADGRARNRAYDIQTKHGETQGVELGP